METIQPETETKATVLYNKTAYFYLNNKFCSIALTGLELCSILANRLGFDRELDAEPMGQGLGWKITSKSKNATVSARGEDLEEAAAKLMEVMWASWKQEQG